MTALGGVTSLLLGEQTQKASAGLVGDVWFDNGSGGLTENDLLHWDNTNARLGIGTTSPARSVHLQGNNACFRMDRNVNSSAFILTRTDPSFSTIWKAFYVGVDASGVNNGSFFIGDVGTNVGGPSAKRLVIDNQGKVGIGTTDPQTTLHVLGTGALFDCPAGGELRLNSSSNTAVVWAKDGAPQFDILNDIGVWGLRNLSVFDDVAGQVRILIDPDGKVGIGNFTPPNNPKALLHVAGSTPNIIMGDSANTITAGVVGTTIGGGGAGGAFGANKVTDDYGTVCGGLNNMAGDNMGTTSDRSYASVGGGVNNMATGFTSRVCGGDSNLADGNGAAIGGGSSNEAAGDFSVVGGGNANLASTWATTVAGGVSNVAGSVGCTVGGGTNNNATGAHSMVAGGSENKSQEDFATVSGGYGNTASGIGSTVCGGGPSTTGTFLGNTASGTRATVGGGGANVASGPNSMVPGGLYNSAEGALSSAGGYRAKALHTGCFVWADDAEFDFSTTGNDQFLVRCTGGAKFVTGVNSTGDDDYGLFISAGGAGSGMQFTGTFTANLKLFQIDHPLDPERKFLRHAAVESSELKNIYDGVVTLDAEGEFWVELPAWFEPLNKDFRYQLTCLDAFSPVYIAREIHDGRFKIAGGKPGMRVCWMVTGIRHDSYAEANPLTVEEDKGENPPTCD